jgi:membrane protease YdiL (CAAX protease family)
LVISVLADRPVLRAAVLASYVLLVSWTRALASNVPYASVAVLVLGGLALMLAGAAVPFDRLGLGRSRLGFRILGGLALAVVLLIPAAARAGAAPTLPAFLAVPAIVVSIGEEIAFRGALYAALHDLGGAPVAIIGSTALWTAAHALSHPPEFLFAVAAAGLLLALWRWACKDLVGPIVGHVIADLAL